MRGRGGSREAQLRTELHALAGGGLSVRNNTILCAIRRNTQFEHARPSHPRNTRSQSIRRERAEEARSRSHVAFLARRHRSWIEAKSGSAPLKCRNRFGAWPALGAIERPSAARGGSALCCG